MVDKADIIEKTVSNTAVDASKNADKKTAEIESARQLLKSHIAQSGLSSLEQSKLIDEVDRALDGASTSLIPININQFVVGLTARIKQEINEEKAAEDKTFNTRAMIINAYEAIQLSAAAKARIERACQSFNPHSYESVYNYAAGIVDQSLPPALHTHHTEAMADYLTQDPQGKQNAQTWANLPPEEKHKRKEAEERAEARLDQLEKDHNLTPQQHKLINLAKLHKFSSRADFQEALAKQANGEITMSELEATLKVAEQSYDGRHQAHSKPGQHHKTKSEQKAEAAVLACNGNVCQAHEDIDLWDAHETDAVWIDKAKKLANEILTNGTSAAVKMTAGEQEMAMAYLHHGTEAEKQQFDNLVNNQFHSANKALEAYRNSELVQEKGMGASTSHVPDAQMKVILGSIPAVQDRSSDNKDARINAYTNILLEDQFLSAYNKKYGADDIKKSVTKLDESGALVDLFGAGAAAKTVWDVATNVTNVNKLETDKISHTAGLGVKNRLEKIGVSKETAQEWGHNTTEFLKAGADKKDKVIKSVSETASNSFDFISEKFGHDTLGNQIDKNLAAINKSGTFTAVSDGNGKKIFNLDGKDGISKEELMKVLEKHGITDLSQLDKNGDGLSQGELVGALNKIMKEERAAGMAQKIEVVAKNLIDKDFAQGLKNANITFSKDEMKVLDANHDGKLDINDKDQIVALLKKKGIDLNGFDKDHKGIDVNDFGDALHKAAATPSTPTSEAKKQQQTAKAH